MPLIKLTLINNRAFCFNVNDYMTIRCEHRITGRLVGSTAKWPRNSNLNGLPAIYSPYETQLMIDKAIIQLCQKNFDPEIDENIKHEYAKLVEEHSKTFQDIYCNKKVEDAKSKLARIMAGKRKKAEKSGGNPDDITEESVLNEIRANCSADSENIFSQIPTQEPFDVDFVDVRAAPNLDLLKYRVYSDLHAKGKWLTSGERFGGDFLIYPGDPLYFHASHIIHVLSPEDAKSLSCLTFATRVRLSVNVNKLCIFVYEDEESKELCYQTSQWLGK